MARIEYTAEEYDGWIQTLESGNAVHVNGRRVYDVASLEMALNAGKAPIGHDVTQQGFPAILSLAESNLSGAQSQLQTAQDNLAAERARHDELTRQAEDAIVAKRDAEARMNDAEARAKGRTDSENELKAQISTITGERDSARADLQFRTAELAQANDRIEELQLALTAATESANQAQAANAKSAK